MVFRAAAAARFSSVPLVLDRQPQQSGVVGFVRLVQVAVDSTVELECAFTPNPDGVWRSAAQEFDPRTHIL